MPRSKKPAAAFLDPEPFLEACGVYELDRLVALGMVPRGRGHTQEEWGVMSRTRLAEKLGVERVVLVRRRYNVTRAEDFAEAEGLHPAEVWGDAYWRAVGLEQ